jgi:hypothetical protein
MPPQKKLPYHFDYGHDPRPKAQDIFKELKEELRHPAKFADFNSASVERFSYIFSEVCIYWTVEQCLYMVFQMVSIASGIE